MASGTSGSSGAPVEEYLLLVVAVSGSILGPVTRRCLRGHDHEDAHPRIQEIPRLVCACLTLFRGCLSVGIPLGSAQLLPQRHRWGILIPSALGVRRGNVRFWAE